MVVRINNQIPDYIMPRYAGRRICIGIDSSKSNSGIAVGDEAGDIIDWIELNGVDDGTTEVDTLLLCKKQREVLKVIFRDSLPFLVGIENIITKKSGGNTKNQETGMTVHTSRFKITAVFNSFIFFFQDTFGITPQLVNNQAWKHAVLPETFRSRSVGKGSLAYFRSINSRFAYCTDDVTDAICILKYLCKINNIENLYTYNQIEFGEYKHNAYLVTETYNMDFAITKFKYNNTMTLNQNVDCISNAIGRKKCAGIAKVPVEDLQLAEIYKFCSGTFQRQENNLYLIVINEA